MPTVLQYQEESFFCKRLAFVFDCVTLIIKSATNEEERLLDPLSFLYVVLLRPRLVGRELWLLLHEDRAMNPRGLCCCLGLKTGCLLAAAISFALAVPVFYQTSYFSEYDTNSTVLY